MPEETSKPSRKKWYWLAGVICVLLISGYVTWLYLPEIVCCGVKYEWSREYALDVLEWLGPRAAGAMFEYHENFQYYYVGEDIPTCAT